MRVEAIDFIVRVPKIAAVTNQVQEQEENDPETMINQLRSQLEEQGMAMEQTQTEMQKASEQLQAETQTGHELIMFELFQLPVTHAH